ncbi:hypothetical protein [Bacteroides sedimenti]|uniref:TIR domain-containing protein n=1 Tax=Bacteroides sedimenti TaxID=2136147 RepID=A0ABM8IAE3_9BACE
MSTIYTNEYLKTLSRTKTLTESLGMFSAQSEAHASFDIFLSHSYLDKEAVEGIYIELTRMGFKVYVDWIIDPNLDRTNITKATATIIQNRLKCSKALLLATSLNASVSKWMPWELGYVDGHTNKCAIMPVSEYSSSPTLYKGYEYLSLYPFIVKQKNRIQEEKLWIVEASDEYVVIEDWLIKNTQPYKRNVKLF